MELIGHGLSDVPRPAHLTVGEEGEDRPYQRLAVRNRHATAPYSQPLGTTPSLRIGLTAGTAASTESGQLRDAEPHKADLLAMIH